MFRIDSFPYALVQSKKYPAHSDGIWDIATWQVDGCIIGTASADQTAKIWHANVTQPLISYHGHSGSVNR